MTLYVDPQGRGATVIQVATVTTMMVFQPRHPGQFRRGFERDRWYFAPQGESWQRPRSNGYASLEEAIAAVNVDLGEFAPLPTA